jgi:predicted N-acetyltransferase YhbS
LVEKNGKGVGHVLFSKVTFPGSEEIITATILCPLGVHADHQAMGIGKALVQEGLRQLADSGTDLVFVLGHLGYYPRFGFNPAAQFDLAAPYPIAEKNSDAWMVLELADGILGSVRGRIRCADVLMVEKYWME